MTGGLDALRCALRAAEHPLAHHALAAMPDKGLAHDHVRLVGSGWLARIPKQSQMGLDAAHNLAYQRACFERSALGGHTPQLHSVLAPSDLLPRGALLVQEIVGRPARLPHDLPAIATALASLHTLDLPAPAGRAPLLDAADPLLDLLQEITTQTANLECAQVAPLVTLVVEQQMETLRSLCEQSPRPPRCLIAFDGHPGNFIVRPDGTAVLVDLEKCRYAYPGLDLAHATLYTSTTWDLDTHAVLSQNEVVAAYRAWADAAGPLAAASLAWQVPLRRAMWLWSITWCAKWRVLSRERASGSAAGEDWSAERSDDQLVTHVRERVDHYLSEAVVEQVLAGWYEARCGDACAQRGGNAEREIGRTR
jgi:thiamine kinase-like enzyme